MVWIRISKKDYSFTEGSWTLSKAKLSEVGTRAKDGSYPERNVKCCVRKGYLYVLLTIRREFIRSILQIQRM